MRPTTEASRYVMWDMAALRSAGSRVGLRQPEYSPRTQRRSRLPHPARYRSAELWQPGPWRTRSWPRRIRNRHQPGGSSATHGIPSRKRYIQMRKSLLLAATAAASAMLVLAPTASAFAATHDVLTTVKVGGPNVKVKDVLRTGLKAKTVLVFASVSGTPISLKCTASTITGKVTANPAAPGTAVESLTGETVTGCKANTTLGKSVTVTATKLPNKATIRGAKGFPVTVIGPSATRKIVTTLI